MSIKRIILIIVLIFGFIVFEKYVLDTFIADIYVKQGRSYLENGNLEEALIYFDKAIFKNPNESFYYKNRAQLFITLASVSEKYEDKYALKSLALADLEHAYSLNEKNLRFIRNSIPLYYYLAIDDYTLGIGINNLDKDFINKTIEFYELIKTNYSNDVGTLSDVYKYEIKLGRGEDTREKIKELRPDLLEWYFN